MTLASDTAPPLAAGAAGGAAASNGAGAAPPFGVGAAPNTVGAADAPALATSPLAGLSFAVVPHTHWDREWYLPFEVFRVRLVRTVEHILDVLEGDPRFAAFTLDGQAAIVDDVLELRPDLRDRIAALARDGRLALGPSYVLPDELLVDGETHVRNLLLGREVVRSLGAETMAIGYAPDAFGHTAQMPQILRGFGLDGFVFWRGMGDEVDRLGPVFRWVAPDGSAVWAIRQLDGYGGGSELGRWTESGVGVHGRPEAYGEAAARRFARFVERHAGTVGRGGLRHLALANGGDHHAIQDDVPHLLEAASRAHPGARFAITRYDRYLDAIRPALDASLGASLVEGGVVDGELLGAREAAVLRGVNSTRMPIKLAHERTERGLRVAETLSSLAWLTRQHAYPADALRHAWRELLRNSPHDSITGCSVDAVHRTMLDRYARVDQVTDRLRREALAAMVGLEARWSDGDAPSPCVSFVNPLPVARRGVVRVVLPAELRGSASLIADRPGGPLAVQPDGPDGALVVVDLPAWGATSVTVRRTIARGEGSARVVDARTIETDRLRVRVSDGALELTELATGRTWPGVGWFEDVADRGDEYTFAALDGDLPWTSLGRRPVVRVTRDGPLVAELEVAYTARLPRGLEPSLDRRSARLVRVPITLRARLVAGLDRLELDVAVNNRALDHRLRLRVDDPAPASTVRAATPFAVLRREPGPRSDGAGWEETPEPTDHMAGFVASGSLAVLAPGLPEYQAIPRDDGAIDLAVTLLRCVGMLGRDLPSRTSGAGPDIPTPDAQCPGAHAFRLAVQPSDRLASVDLVLAAQDHATPFEIGPAGTHRPVPLALAGDALAFSTLKLAEDGDGVILRAWNPELHPVSTTVEGRGLVAERCRLDETALVGGAADGATAADRGIGPAEIATWRVRPA